MLSVKLLLARSILYQYILFYIFRYYCSPTSSIQDALKAYEVSFKASVVILACQGHLTLSLSQLWKLLKVDLTFEGVNEILWCDHSNETSSAVLSLGTICFSIFCKNESWDFS